MSHRFAGVLFDLDGTLVDTAPDFAGVLNRLLAAHDRPALPYATIRQAVSQGARAVVALGFADLGIDTPAFEEKRQAFLSDYRQHLADESTLFVGLDEVLKALEAAGCPWGIVTNKPSHFTNPLLDALKLTERCRIAICPDHVTRTKPDAEPMFKACDVLALPPAEVLYVGDHLRDIQAGKNAGMPTAAAAWGYIPDHEDAADWQADYLLPDIPALRALLDC